MNPCTYGYLGDLSGRCRCTPEQIQRYRAKLSGPPLDRIDLHLTVGREATRLAPQASTESSADFAARVAVARERQLHCQGCPNAFLDLASMHQNCALTDQDQAWLETAGERMNLSLRALHRILKVTRTLADLEGDSAIARPHLTEALQYRAGH